ncbi:solute carrier family 22 member 15-like [Folsomia candida]|uniref:Organic cation transporter protein n=1 Tax=Folsomia candida TaxID=158441 RepID=A0A226DH34_FOLCA|nr:solute carrier family 22 member 15-like [Folsomia candida]XP_035714484.1 solute carrier family 22 member 15-like [Folsomia candida]OXA44164.1 Organic cation transporter protein [Folsomia candida]
MKPELNKKTKGFEEVLEDCGGFGKFQFIVLVALLLPEIPAAFVAFAPVFVGRSIANWSCVVDGNGTVDEVFTGAMCDCPGTLLLSDESSIVAEWGLVCQHSWVSDFITSVQMLGMLIGSLFSSQISDWYGRKWVYIGVCGLMAFGQGLSSLAPNPVVYAVARFFAGAGISGFMGMSTIYPLEFMTPNYRLLIGSVGPWGEGIMLFALLAYYVAPWRSLLFYSALPFIFVIVVVPFIPESPRYLLRQGRVEEAVQVVRKIQSVNHGRNHHHDLITFQTLDAISREEAALSGSGSNGRFSYVDFFRDAQLRRKTLLLMGIWFSWSIVYFGISYNIKNLRGDAYLNVALMGLSDALGYPAALLINNKLGRRKSLVIFMSLGACFLVLLAGLELSFGTLMDPGFVAFLTLSGKFGVAGARSAARMLTGESFPTSIRTMGYGISGVTAGVGGIFSPQIAYFGALWWGPLPFVTFAVISVGGSLLSLLLPETAGKLLSVESSGLIAGGTKKGGGHDKKKNYKSTSCC